MFNPQSFAVNIERILTKRGYATLGNAYLIAKDPIGYMDSVLKDYELMSEEHEKRSADFWDKYESYKGKSMGELGADLSQQLVKDIRKLFN